MLTITDDYKLSLYHIEKEIHKSLNCCIYLVKSSLDNKLYIKRVYINSNMSELFNEIKNKRVRNTPEIFEVIYDGSDTIVIEEYILGYSLESVTLTKNNLYEVLNNILLSVEDLHSINIIHRDIKPSNILVTKDYKAYLIDFGIARFYSDTIDTDTTQSGTKGFASPEQYGFQQTDFRSDIYSIGKTIESLVKSNNINVPLKKVISKSISFDPKDRYSSVTELKRAIDIRRLRILFITIGLLIFILIIISTLLLNNNKVAPYDNLISEETTESVAPTTVPIENTTNLVESTVVTTENATIIEPTTVAYNNDISATTKQPSATKNNKTTSNENKVKLPENKNILKYYENKFYYNGLIVPNNTDFLELLGGETSKTCGIAINNTYVTCKCIKNNSNFTLNLSDTLGHTKSLNIKVSEEQLKNCSFPNDHSFNAYIFFLDYNNDGNTEIFVNFTDAYQQVNSSGSPIYVDYGSGQEPYVNWNFNMLKLVEHTSSNGFYVYDEVMSTYSNHKFKVGGAFTNGIFCDEYSTIFKPHNGIISEEMA